MNHESKAVVEELPELHRLSEYLTQQVNKMEALSLDINNKLQGIKNYSEPDQGKPECIEEIPTSFIESTQSLIRRIDKYNERLEFSLRHLNKLL
jgi:prefoldin subunit 5